MKIILKLMIFFSLILFYSVSSFISFAEGVSSYLPDDLYKISELSQGKSKIRAGQVSSFDRTGGNDDGFSGKYSFLRREGGKLVLADLEGPGCITRIWTPTLLDRNIEFYFNEAEEAALIIPFRKLFDGSFFPFISPSAESALGGYVSYVPIPFSESCKVAIDSEKMNFYQITYHQYDEQPLESFPSIPDEEYRKHHQMFELKTLSAMKGEFRHARSETREIPQMLLAPGQKATLWECHGAYKILNIELESSDYDGGVLRAVILRIFWDGSPLPAVEVPLGDFFGQAFGESVIQSYVISSKPGFRCSFPMPFKKKAVFELDYEQNYHDQFDKLLVLSGEVAVQPINPEQMKNEKYFHAVWRRENPTTKHLPYSILDVEGSGHFVGFQLQCTGKIPGLLEYFEGDERIFVDGELAIHGTGSEDCFNGGWYNITGRWDHQQNLPLYGCTRFDLSASQTGAYRWYIGDFVPFSRSFRMEIEHGPVNNNILTDYCSTAYYYEASPAGNGKKIPGLDERSIMAPDLLVFEGEQLPIPQWSFTGPPVDKPAVDKEKWSQARYLRLKGDGKCPLGYEYIMTVVEIEKEDDYEVQIFYAAGQEFGSVQLFLDGFAFGPKINCFSEKFQRKGPISLGIKHFQKGNHIFEFRIFSENKEIGKHHFGLDKIEFKRLRHRLLNDPKKK